MRRFNTMKISREKMIEMYTIMMKIRVFESRISKLTAEGKIPGFVHLYIGEEAIAAGVCTVLRKTDYITSTHRGHGHLIAKGGEVKYMMAELFGKSTGYCKGKGGSMHIANIDLGILGANGIVGGGPPIATGAALAIKYKGRDDVTVCFIGDGASNQGTTHEAMNLASVLKLPVIFLMENNRVAEFTFQDRHQCVESIAERAPGYRMPGLSVDGTDIIAVHEAASEAVTAAREGKGPTLLECKAYRFHGHYEGDPQLYRPEGQVEEWEKHDPIPIFEKSLLEKKVVSEKQIEDIKKSIEKEIDEAVSFAEESPLPERSDILQDVYSV
jgi:pyruvate dehydrogenase E1 component alpha subunit